MTDLNPQGRQMADESMVRNLAAQARLSAIEGTSIQEKWAPDLVAVEVAVSPAGGAEAVRLSGFVDRGAAAGCGTASLGTASLGIVPALLSWASVADTAC